MSWELVGGVVAMSGLLWGIYTTRRGWRHSNIIRRAEFVRGYTNDFYESDDLPCLFLEIDQGRFRFTPEAKGTRAEVELAHLLDYFNTIGMSVEEGILNVQDLRRTTIGYAALVTWRNSEVRAFLESTAKEDSQDHLPFESFAFFRKLGQRLSEVIPGDRRLERRVPWMMRSS